MNQENESYREELIIDGPPWEKRETIGFFNALKLTLVETFRNPIQVFALMRRSGDLGSALQYSVLLQILGTVISLALGVLITGDNQIIPPWMNEMLGGGHDWGTIFLISLPIMAIIEQYMKAFFLNMAFGMLGHARYSYDTAFRITAYANGTAAVWAILPGIGGLIYLGYNVFLMLIGFRTIYGLRNGQIIGSMVLAAFLGFASLILLSLVAAIFMPNAMT